MELYKHAARELYSDVQSLQSHDLCRVYQSGSKYDYTVLYTKRRVLVVLM